MRKWAPPRAGLQGTSGFCSSRHKGRSKRDGLLGGGGGKEVGAADWGLENRGRRVLGTTLGPQVITTLGPSGANPDKEKVTVVF